MDKNGNRIKELEQRCAELEKQVHHYKAAAGKAARKRESEIEELSRQRARLLFYHTPVMIHSIDSEGRLLEVNEHWLKKMGYAREEVLGRKSTEFMTPDSRKFVDEKLRPEFFKTGAARKAPIGLVTKDGCIIQTLCSASGGYNDQGEVIYSLAVFQDVTRQIEMEKALRESEQRYRLLFHQSPLGIVHHDRNGVIVDVNEKYTRMIGAEREQMIGFNARERVKDPAMIRAIEATLKGESGCFKGDYTSAISGKNITVNALLQAIRDGAGKLIGGIAIFEDIADQVRAEKKLKKSEALMRIQRNLGVALATTCDLEEALRICLSSALEIGGIDCGAIYLVNIETGDLDLATHEGLPPEFVEYTAHFDARSPQARMIAKGKAVFQPYEKVMRSFELTSEQQRVRTSAGLRSIAVVPIMHEGRSIAVLVAASRTSETIAGFARYALETVASQVAGTLARIRADQALEASQRNLQALFESLDDFLFVIDSNGKIVNFNPIVEKRLGYTAEELFEMHVAEVHPPGRRKEAAEIVQKMLVGEADHCPVPLLAKDGALIPVETKVAMGIWNNNAAIFGISRDISRRLKAEEARKLSEERLAAAIDAIDEGFVMYDADDRLTMCNAKYIDFHKTTSDLLVAGARFEDIVREGVRRGQYADAAGKEEQWAAERIAMHRQANGNFEQNLSDGRWLKISERKMKDGSIVGFRVDITDIKRSQERTRQALREKETLLREIHHRVKNNMQVVSSLLSLQASKIGEPGALAAFAETQARVQSMSLVHEILYRSDSFAQINAQDYLQNLANQLLQLFTGSGLLRIHVRAHGVDFGIDHAVPCGLIVTELATNAIKYAFAEEKNGRIEIKVSYVGDTEVEMVIADNGVGLPPDFDPLVSRTLGVRLVTELAEDQLEGAWTLIKSPGVCWKIRWPVAGQEETGRV